MSINTDFLDELHRAEALVRRLLSPVPLKAVIARSLDTSAAEDIEAYATYIGQVRLLRELFELDVLNAHTLTPLTASMKSKSAIIEPALDRLDAWHRSARAGEFRANTRVPRR